MSPGNETLPPESAAPQVGDRPAGLQIMPLGGCGEVGLNCTLLTEGAHSLLIDCGVLLSTADAPGVNRAIPDFSPLKPIASGLQALVLTHGHEDHIGAIDKLLDEYDLEIFGPRLAISLVRSRLEGQKDKLKKLHEIQFGERENFGPFEVEWIRVTHSIPDSAALFIRSPSGKVLHTGDFKLDPDPVDGIVTDIERLKAIGDAGLDLLLSDSTNSEQGGCVEPESRVGLALERAIFDAKKRVLITCFSSHFHRIQNIAKAAEKSNRKIIIVGRSLQGAWRRGINEGYLDVPPELCVDTKYFETLAPKEVLILASGTQGETRSAVSRLAQERNTDISLEAGDCFIRSAMTIPGNVLPYRRVVNAFVRRGIEVIDDRGAGLHCSGHGHVDEQIQMIKMLRPKCFVPIHGERSMLSAHAKTAIQNGVAERQTLIVEDGESFVLRQSQIERAGIVDLRPIFIDGVSNKIISWDAVGQRRKVGFGGTLVCSILVDRQTGQPQVLPLIEVAGIPECPGLTNKLAKELFHAFNQQQFLRDEALEISAKRMILKTLKKTLGIRPLVFVQLHEL
jgi:ribonuclease J